MTPEWAVETMHELSIAMSIVEMAQEEALQRGVQVSAVHLKLGALSGVVKEALLSSYEMACDDTPLRGSRLVIEDVPVVIFCPHCKRRGPSVRFNYFAARNAVRRLQRSFTARNLK